MQRTRERAVAAAAAALLLLSFAAKAAAAAAAPHTRRRQLAAHLRAHNRPDVVLALAAVVAQLKSAAQLLVDINKFLIYAKLEIRIACLDLTIFFPVLNLQAVQTGARLLTQITRPPQKIGYTCANANEHPKSDFYPGKTRIYHYYLKIFKKFQRSKMEKNIL